MRSRLCVLLVMLLAIMPGIPAQADVGSDFSGMTLDELYAMREALNAHIAELESQSDVRLYESGTYHIGVDIPEGDYVIYENEDAMFASVVVRTGNTQDADLVTYHLIDVQAVIRLESDMWLTLSEARACPISQAAPALNDAGQTGEGGYLVGMMLPAGEYVATPLDKAPLSSYSVYGGVLGTGAQLLKFEVLHEAVDVTLSEGEYVVLSGCALTPNP